MVFVDAHTHLTEVTFENLEWMYLVGIREVVAPAQLVATQRVSCKTIKDVWDHQLGMQTDRAATNLIKAYTMLAISMVSMPAEDPQELYEALPEYLKMPKVVAIGEIGFEPASKSCPDLGFQEEVVRNQVLIAKNSSVPVDFHVPHPPEKKKAFTEKTLKICQEIGIPFSRVIIDHCSEANIEMVLEAGAAAAISVQPWRGLTPEIAADLVIKYGPERVMLNSDCGTNLSDPCAVAKTAYVLKKKGVADEIIDKVCRANCKKIFNLPE